MRDIDFAEPQTPDWIDWRQRCVAAQKTLIDAIQAGNTPTINEDLYKEQKVSVLMSYDYAFRGKCAYCDRDIHNQFGDVEHYRPKGRVTDSDGKAVTRRINGSTVPHPGYYWLVYDWTNLLPACIRCNRPSARFTDWLIGKWDKFPVADFRAWDPGDENRETPLFIHPARMSASEHLRFERNGVIGWRSPAGKLTVKILGLNKYGLPDRRKSCYESTRSLVADYFSAYRQGENNKRAKCLHEELTKIREGFGDFTVYSVMAMEDEIRLATEAIIDIT